jgi:hypothetical protein
MTKICLDCGVTYDDDAAFCGYCRHPLEDYEDRLAPADDSSITLSESIEWTVRAENLQARDALAKQSKDQSWERLLDEILDGKAFEDAPTRKS